MLPLRHGGLSDGRRSGSRMLPLRTGEPNARAEDGSKMLSARKRRVSTACQTSRLGIGRFRSFRPSLSRHGTAPASPAS